VKVSKPNIEEILAPKPEARPRIYAYTIEDQAHKGLLKIGQTSRDVKQRDFGYSTCKKVGKCIAGECG
jgi:hypothetical protein